MRRLLFAMCLSTLTVSTLRAADPSPPPMWPPLPSTTVPVEDKSETERIIRDLSSEDFATRERASAELKQKGVTAFPGLRERASAIADPEVQARLTPLFQKPPLVPPPLSTTRMRDVLDDYERARARNRIDDMVRILDDSRLTGEEKELFYAMIEKQETNSVILESLRQKAPKRAPIRSRLAILQGDVNGAEKILHDAYAVGLPVWTDYVALVALRRAAEFDPLKEYAKLRGLGLNEREVNYSKLLFLRATGNVKAALPYVRALADGSSYTAAFTVALEARDYGILTEVLSVPEEHAPRPKAYCPEILAARLAGRPIDVDAALKAAIALQPKDNSYDDAINTTMLMNERVDDAVTFLCDHADGNRAFMILAFQLRLREAFKLRIDYPAKPAHLLVTLGLKKQAQEMLLAHKPDLNRNPGQAAQTLFDYAAELRFAGLEQEARDAENLAWKWRESQPINYGSPQALFPDYSQYRELVFWIGANPFNADQARFDAARRILNGEVHPILKAEMVPDYLPRVPSIYELQTAVQALSRIGEIDFATQLTLASCAQAHDPTGMSVLGDSALEHGQPALAYRNYLQAAVLDRTDAALMYKAGLALSRSPETRDAGQALIAFKEFLVLGDRNQASRVAEAMRRFQSPADGDAWFFDHDARFGDPRSSSLNERFARARYAAETKGDYREALALQTQALFRPDRLVDLSPVNTMANLALYHRLRALDAWTRKDFFTLADALWREMDNGPPDPDLLEKTLPALRAADPAAAQKILTRALDRLQPIVQDYPDATLYKTQLTRLQSLAQ